MRLRSSRIKGGAGVPHHNPLITHLDSVIHAQGSVPHASVAARRHITFHGTHAAGITQLDPGVHAPRRSYPLYRHMERDRRSRQLGT